MSLSGVKVWDLPLRVWHWLFAAAVFTSLGTGLIEAWYSVEIHQWSGITVVALLVFRISWGFWGSPYARWVMYITTPSKVISHFRGQGVLTPHTAPGIALVVILMLCVLVQATSGLFMTDDIFYDGPFYRLIDDDTFTWVSAIHRNIWMIVVTAVSAHLLAHVIYGLVLRDPTPLSMISGKKNVAMTPVTTPWARAVLSLLLGLATFIVIGIYAE